MKITTLYNGPDVHIVKLEGKTVGRIFKTPEGFRYIPTGSKTGGEFFPTLEACKSSLEAE